MNKYLLFSVLISIRKYTFLHIYIFLSFKEIILWNGNAKISISVISSMTNVFADYVGRYPEMHFARGNSRDGSMRPAIDARKIVKKWFIDRPLELRSLRALLAATAVRRGKEIVLIFTDI